MKASEYDVTAGLGQLAHDVNTKTKGLIVKYISREKGYGLFADRDYNTYNDNDPLMDTKGGMLVLTTYNGVRTRTDPRTQQSNHDYIMWIGEKLGNDWHIDGRVGFGLNEKGRWMNQPNADERGEENCAWRIKEGTANLGLDGVVVEIVAIDDIEEGDELTVDYGDEFRLQEYSNDDETDHKYAPNKRPKLCEYCMKYTDYECQACGRSFCSAEHLDAIHKFCSEESV